jgi:pilus assembly protein CpaC
MKIRAFRFLAAGIFLLPSVAMADGPAPAQATPSGPGESAFDRRARDILDQLKVNDVQAPAYAAIPAARERPAHLAAGTSESIYLPIGGARTVTLPGPFESAVVVSPEVAQVIVATPGRVQIIARTSGTTDVVFTAASGETYKARVTVTMNAGPVEDALRAALPGERIQATAVNGSVVLSGSTRDAAAATTAVNIARRFVQDAQNGVVNNIQILGGQQVMLRVRVAEVDRTVMKQLGLNTALGTGAGTTGGNAPGLAAYGMNAPVGTISGQNPGNPAGGIAPLLALGAATNPIGFISSKAFGTVFTTVASALESEGFVRSLAEPNLVTQSGKSASMLAGAQYPVPTVSQSGRSGTEYRPFGVSLAFTPTVQSANSIQLDIATEVSSIGQSVTFPDGNGGNYSIPVFNTRKATTSVELPSGGSIVIAGLMSNDMQNSLSGLPGIKDIPIIGKLFSSVNFQHNQSELVISVTAYLVGPTDAAAVASPTDSVTTPSDLDLYLLNRLSGSSSRHLGPPPPRTERDFGFITE